MSNFSILVRLQDATEAVLNQLVLTLEAQTEPDWELVLVCSQVRDLDRRAAADMAALHPKVRMVTRPEEELVYWTANQMLQELGTWVGFMGQRDLLQPTALAELQLAIAGHPDAKVAFTDEESRNQHGRISLRFNKGAINPIRLRTQEYLRDFTVFERDWLIALGGFSRMASDWPAHDVHLRTLELRGPGGFVNVPSLLFQRFRNHRIDTTDARRRDHMVGFDLWAMRQHAKRQGLPAEIHQRNGTAECNLKWSTRLAVTLIINAPAEQHLDIARAIDASSFKPAAVKWAFNATPAELNDLARYCDTPLVCFLNAVPVNADWLAELVDHAMVPGVGAIGARLMTPIQLTQPGLLGYRFEGWDWNSRGRFNELAVPHQVSAVSPHCLLIDVQLFLGAGGFSPEFPRLHAMDLCLRLDQSGCANVLVPGSQALVRDAVLPDAGEIAAFENEWADWTCRFGLHLP